jgi:SAM-dependent methyltransferase
MNDEGPNRPDSDTLQGLRPRWAKTLVRLFPWALKRDADRLRAEIASLHSEFEAVVARLADTAPRFDAVEHQVSHAERRLEAADERFQTISSERERIEEEIRKVQGELEELREGRTRRLESRMDEAERKTGAASDEVERLRDRVVPAVVERGNVLVERLSDEIEEVASLVERMLLGEPLPVAAPDPERRLSGALAEIQPRLLAEFRGTEEEIRHRLDHYLPTLRDSAPVLDIGSGRGELLLMLREAGVEASGVEADAALAQGARRRGLEVTEGDALETLRAQPDEAWGAVTAIHFLEHLDLDRQHEFLAEARRVLRPGGLLIAECPNPHCLRVGAALYWQDPTHRRPLLPESLKLYLEAGGYEVVELEYLHPFPSEQLLASDEISVIDLPSELTPLAERIDRLAVRLDDLLNGPRDFAITAARPSS